MRVVVYMKGIDTVGSGGSESACKMQVPERRLKAACRSARTVKICDLVTLRAGYTALTRPARRPLGIMTELYALVTYNEPLVNLL